MSASTGQQERQQTLARFASLNGKAIQLIEEGKRSPQMINALLGALQLFRDNQLGVAMRLQTALSPEERQKILSLSLAEARMEPSLRKYFASLGIEFVGELYLLKWTFSSSHEHKQGKKHRQMEEFLASLSLPPVLDLKEAGWKPPYDTAEFRARLNTPATEVLIPYSPGFHPRGVPPHPYKLWWHATKWGWSVGKLLSRPREDHYDFRTLRESLKRGSGIRAGMWIGDWQPPSAE